MENITNKFNVCLKIYGITLFIFIMIFCVIGGFHEFGYLSDRIFDFCGKTLGIGTIIGFFGCILSGILS